MGSSIRLFAGLAGDGGCSSVVEHWIVAPVVAGSIPVTHPIVPPTALTVALASASLLEGANKRRLTVTGRFMNPPRSGRKPTTTSSGGFGRHDKTIAVRR